MLNLNITCGTMTLPPRSTTDRGRVTLQQLQTVTPSASYCSHSPTHIIVFYYYSQLACSSSTLYNSSTSSACRRAAAAENRKGKYCSTSTPLHSLPHTHNVIISPHTLPVSPDPNVSPVPTTPLPSAVVSTRRHGPRSQPQDPSSMILYCKQTGH